MSKRVTRNSTSIGPFLELERLKVSNKNEITYLWKSLEKIGGSSAERCPITVTGMRQVH